MPKFAANISMMFNELPFLDRFAAARAAGFEAVEFLFPYEHPAEEIAKRLEGNGLANVLFNAPPGDWAKGERGIGSHPDRRAEFREGLKLALEYAAVLKCPRLHIMAGLAPRGVPREAALVTFAANLEIAAEECAKAGIKPVIEPINHRDIPGYFLNTTAQATRLINILGMERVGLQFDLYHCQITEGDVSRKAQELLPYIAHMQVADNPGRNEPGTGEVNWDFVFNAIDASGYRGWIGCEYRPKAETVAGLGWFAKYRAA
jgi:hydroxypyruvate isomerase